MHELPTTYRAAVISEPGATFELVERRLLPPSDNQLLLKIYASGICYSDRAATSGSPLSSYPRVPGHEVVGRVVAYGPDVSSTDRERLPPGSLVGAGWLGSSCQACEACEAEETFACPQGVAHGAGMDGGHAEYMYTTAQGLVRLPEEALEHLSYAELAPILCAGVSAYDALLSTRNSWIPEDVVGVHGVGGIGHLAIQYAVKMGLQVHAITSPGKFDLARTMGAIGAVNATSDLPDYFSQLGGARLIISTVPSPGGSSSTLAQCLARNGTIIFVGIPYGGDSTDALDISTTLMVVKRLQVRGWVPGCARKYAEAVKFSIQAGIKPMIKTFRLEDIQHAMENLLDDRPAQRNVIVFSDTAAR
ncbi:GroES-like protein [Exidia glandulosa HHB12029]|uniref:GroES-like protein n=1 Tax=Exidia glandulosa HHB12029 TaxID=1314781 RepID=A0A165GZ46_EXIGL|nr:GroES-like protein [Exidia glandulosa HHB12029]